MKRLTHQEFLQEFHDEASRKCSLNNKPLELSMAVSEDRKVLTAVLDRGDILCISGNTGMGKSSAMHFTLARAYERYRNRIVFYGLDFKGVEGFESVYNHIPNAMCFNVLESYNFTCAMEAIEQKLVERSNIIERSGCESVDEHNERISHGDLQGEIIPLVLFVIHELHEDNTYGVGYELLRSVMEHAKRLCVNFVFAQTSPTRKALPPALLGVDNMHEFIMAKSMGKQCDARFGYGSQYSNLTEPGEGVLIHKDDTCEYGEVPYCSIQHLMATLGLRV